MSTEDQNRCVITLHKDVDTTKFMEEMKAGGYELHDEKPMSVSNFDYVMTKEQAAELRKDSRVVDVRYGSKAENGIIPMSDAYMKNQEFHKDGVTTGGNWGFPAMINTTDLWGGSSSVVNYSPPFTLTGKNVDVVIQDSGIQPDHPEWNDRPLENTSVIGTTRYQTVDWPTISGLQSYYTQNANYHRDLDGHGTHVAGTACGKLYGWAKEANIYSLKILDDPGVAFGISASFSMLRAWHNAKKAANQQNDQIPIRPTICNMSWSYYSTYENCVSGVWRGTSWSGTNSDVGNGTLAQYGLIAGSSVNGNWTWPVRVASVDSDILDCLNAGIIFVAAAGNRKHRMDLPGGTDYDNYFNDTNLGQRYYHRGATPGAYPKVITVGSIDTGYVSGQERQSSFTNRGPRVDVYAPGSNIMSAMSNTASANKAAGQIGYPLDTAYHVNRLSGTSMASPQICGLLACILQIRETYTQDEMRQFLNDNADNARMHDSTTGVPANDYADVYSLHGSNNRFAKQPFNSNIAFTYGT